MEKRIFIAAQMVGGLKAIVHKDVEDNKIVLTISGEGTIPRNFGQLKLFDEIAKNDVKEIIIEDGITEIGYWSFGNFISVKSITMPDSVTSISDGAFYRCKDLEFLNIPKSVKTIKDFAFACCSSLTSIAIPSSVTSIGDGAFKWCKKLNLIKFVD